MNRRIVASFVATGLLAGCSFSSSSDGTPREERSKIADLASDALAESVGRPPDDLDCGDGEVDVVEGDVIDGTLTDGTNTFRATVTFTEVDGDEYKIHAEVVEEITE